MSKISALDNQTSGIRLLKKGQKGVFKMLFSRTGIILLLLIINISILFAAFAWFEDFLPHFYGGSAVFTVCMVVFLVNSSMDPTGKITWLTVIMLLPVFGSLLYLFTRAELGHKTMKKRLAKIYAASKCDEPKHQKELEAADYGVGALARYVSSFTSIPVYKNTEVSYYPCGEQMLNSVLEELDKARHSIYLEYFIIDEGSMWGRILEILIKKAAEGVDVRLMYDGSCEFLLLPKGYPKKLRELGISCRVFAPVTPFVSTHYNYRDHRKILTIDGRVAFTGGINLADEYINQKKLYGHWKDTAVMLKGEAVRGFEKMFLQMWSLEERELCLQEPSQEDFSECDGYVLPYFEDPLDSEHIGRQVYIDILARAKRYVHIMTPYLILDGELESALKYAARRGVEVSLLLPAIADKKLPYALAKCHYPALIEAGVKIYEYTPGFVHAKVVVSDDSEAVVGTINFDYRSLYHHFECAVYLYNAPCISDIAQDFNETAAKSSAVTKESIKSEKLFYKIAGRILKIVAPLL